MRIAILFFAALISNGVMAQVPSPPLEFNCYKYHKDKPIDRQDECIKRLNGAVTRNFGTVKKTNPDGRVITDKGNISISIKSENNSVKIIRSDMTACDDDNTAKCKTIYLSRFYPQDKLVLIEENYYEEAAYKLFDLKYGHEITVENSPLFSPNRKSFVDINCHPYRGNILALYSHDGMVFKQKLKTNNNVCYSFLQWKTDDEVVLSNLGEDESPQKGKKYKQSILKKTANGWRLFDDVN